MDTQKTIIFGIEGPAGSGKSTMANITGHELGIPVIEGGRFYRQLTYAALRDGIDLDDTAQVTQLARTLPTRFQVTEDDSILYDGVDVTSDLRDESVSTNVARVSRQLAVREIIEQQIGDAVRAHGTAIIVGRAVKKLFPDAYVLNVTIDPEEAERRHAGRVEGQAESIRERNAIDSQTAQVLGTADAHEATVDVTDFTRIEQAAILKEFIIVHRPE